MTFDVAHLTQPKVGERANGDAVLVRQELNAFLIAVVDGLGHGPDAAKASQQAVQDLATQDIEQPLLVLMRSMHDRLRGTRGVAATVCVVRQQEVEACAVGNVQLSCVNADIPLILSSGILGQRVVKYHVCKGSIRSGARVALFSDGISTRLSIGDFAKLPPAQACKSVFERFRKQEDDATILIADYGSH